jgi:DNA-binding GntR family transcriptional regulator
MAREVQSERGSEIYRALKRDITHFAFKPGDRLIEEQLSERYRVSRTPIREALRRLEEEGLIVSKGSVGRFIPHFNVDQFENVYQVRIVLEELSVVETCERADDRSIWSLRWAWARGFEVGAEALDGRFVEADETFHMGIVELSGNGYLSDSLRRVNDRIRIIRMVDFTTRERITATRAEHDEVLEAIVRRDAETARRLMRRHIERSKDHVRELISRALARIYLGEG